MRIKLTMHLSVVLLKNKDIFYSPKETFRKFIKTSNREITAHYEKPSHKVSNILISVEASKW